MAILKSQRRNRARVAARLSAKIAEQQAAEQQKQQQQQQQPAADKKQPSAPASPQMKPAEATPIEVEQLQQQQQQPDVTSQPASSSSAAQADAAAVPEPQPELSAEDQKASTLLRTVSDRLGQIEFELPTLHAQIANHTARVCIAHLKHRLHKLTPAELSKLQLAHKSVKYTSGMLDENTMQVIFKLDSIQSENPAIRAQRKATVKRGNAIIQESVQLRAKLARWDRFMPVAEHPKQPEVPASKSKQEDVQMKTTEAPAATKAPSTPAAEEAAMMDDEESESEEETEQKYPEPKQAKQQARPATAQPRAAAPAPAAAVAAPALTPLQKKYAHLQLPTYAGPAFHSRMHPHTGALLIEADLSGFQSDDVSVSTEPSTRVLTIRGVKLPSRRRSLPSHSAFGGFFGFAAPLHAPVEPHGFFTKSIAFEELDPQRRLNLGGMTATLNAANKLEISIPRAAQPKVAAAPQRRAPVSHYTGYDDAEDEDDEQADAYSHPYASYYQPRAAAPRRAAYQPSPFFGGGFW